MAEVGARERVLAAMRFAPEELFEAVIDGLAAAGAEIEWDSETITAMLAPLESWLRKAGIPNVSTTGDGGEAWRFWCVVDGRHDPFDPFEGNRAAARQGWQEAVEDEATELGFTEWWAATIEEKAKSGEAA